MKHAFIQSHREGCDVRAGCRVLRVHFSGFYGWLKEKLSHPARDDGRQTGLTRQAEADSGKANGYRKLMDDLRDQGETISKNRVVRLVARAGIAAHIGYKRRPGRDCGKRAIAAVNKPEQSFSASQPDWIWVTDISYIEIHEGWLYLYVVIDPFSRRMVGWSAQSRMTTDLALQVLPIALWRRKRNSKVTMNSN